MIWPTFVIRSSLSPVERRATPSFSASTRPERPEIAAQYCEEMPEFALRLQAKAGLTGYAQVYGKYNTTPYDKLQMDLMYIAHPSLIEDLKIMLATRPSGRLG